ncbi:MAG: tyrosine--tRNA ligase [Bacteroidales bacterium]|nr:tyrosine--tRNA ligase [Bacteroidales bacterium]
MNFIDELNWRGLIHDKTPGVEEYVNSSRATAYVGIDPTADSLHIGHLVSIIMLKHFQNYGHRPILIVGGATGMIGDPSGKSKERVLLDEKTLRHNQECLQIQLSKLLDFSSSIPNSAILLNNYDWMKDYTFLHFIRDIGKHLTVNYMMAKDSVRKRLDSEEGISFTEFTYQLVQGYDFLYLFEKYNCKLQMGGSDQWGNITTGIELIRRKLGGEAYGITCPLLVKPDGTKFGKTEQGNIWLDPQKTSPYQFYQFWINLSDDEAKKYLYIFSFKEKKYLDDLITEHSNTPHLRILQKHLAKEMTTFIHGEAAYNQVVEASEILFGKGTFEALQKMDEQMFLSVFEGVPKQEISKERLSQGLTMVDFIVDVAKAVSSRSEARRLLKEHGFSLNKQKVYEESVVSMKDAIKGRYLILQRGKKNYYLIVIK